MGQLQSKLNPIIAIEIGNVNSGYAYSLGGQIFTATNGYGLPEDRIPTALLLKPDSSVDSFGTHAQDKYLNLTLKKKDGGYQYFEKYSADTKDEWNVELYAEFINFFCERCLKCLNEKQYKKQDVTLILTLTGNYKETERDIMRLAAEKAGIKKDNIRFVLEIDAAAFYIRHQFLFAEKDTSVKKLPKGHRFVLVDLGGKKNKYCKYKILEKNELERIGDIECLDGGSNAVTNEFMKTLECMVYSSNWKKFTEENKSDYMILRRSLEDCKCNFDDLTEQIILEMPQAFITLTDDTKNLRSCRGISLTGENKIIIEWETFLNFYEKSLNEIATALNDIIKSTDVVVLVGGFSQSISARKCIEKKMESKRIVLVPDPDLAVLKGAVMMGCEPSLISDNENEFILIQNVADENQMCTLAGNNINVFNKGQNGTDITNIKCDDKFVTGEHKSSDNKDVLKNVNTWNDYTGAEYECPRFCCVKSWNRGRSPKPLHL